MNLLDYVIPKGLQNVVNPSPLPDFDPQKLGPKDSYLSWTAPGRTMYKGYSEKLLRTFAIIGVFVALFLVIIQEYFLILVVVSMVFVGQVLAKTPPEDSRFEISSYGITIDDHTYYWHELRRFFFIDQDGMSTLAVDLVNGFPARLFLTLSGIDKNKVKDILMPKLHFLEIAPESIMDRTYKSITSKLVS